MIDKAIQRRLVIVQGYLDLGMLPSAAEELEEIPGTDHDNPSLMSIQVAVYTALKNWPKVEESARRLVSFQPEEVAWWINWAFATRRCFSIEAAKQILIEAERRHPHEALIQFNLGCYDCQMGELDAARRRVSAAIGLDRSFQKVALQDPDLEVLWSEIQQIS